MKKLSYLAVPVACLALVVMNCGQVAPTAQNDVVLQQEDEVALPPNAEPAFVPDAPGNCCPVGFLPVGFVIGDPADLNGDGHVCRKVTPGGTITVDNNAPGNCCVPPACI